MAAVMSTDQRREDLEILAKKKFNVRIQSISYLAEDILAFEFVDPDGANLLPFTAGAHIDVHLPSGAIRQYSLCNDPTETHRYVVAVLREVKSRGGSAALHDEVRPGTELTISQPRNHFALSKSASRHVLLAGGIGVTPMMSMVAELTRRGEPFHLYYCTRSPIRTAFLPQVMTLVEKGMATVAHDNGNPENGLVLDEVLTHYTPGNQLYYCGPAGFLDAVEAAAAHWPDEAKHCERFAVAPTDLNAAEPEAQTGFDIKLASTGETYHVEPGRTIVDVLFDNGVDIDVSCEEGYCGTCMTRYLAGHPEHRDTVLDAEDRQEFVMVCCARSKSESEPLVLDI
ncbi:PDR/VanB family oxidoreductase [Salinisphaera aquimarina]|uniref:PDR/VanB family oxidoreductase n=1 Tax=Salinisphaera aquimarina TaxID=2094031 RepID=A0ABV7ERH5_9GAMM